MSDKTLFSIGELAERTGINPDTIRVWERRYGRPRPMRLPSGHRRYEESELSHLRRVAEALARGHRPSKLLRLDPSELDGLLAESEKASSNASGLDVSKVFDAIRGFRRDLLRDELLRRYDEHSPIEFLEEILSPITRMVGRQWANGELAVRHEHFLSETIEDVLRALRLSLEQRQRLPDVPERTVLLATLSGERHNLGLQMVALTCTVCGLKVHNLGVETPVVEIEESMRETSARMLALSVSLATGGIATDRQIRRLRATLPIETQIFVGGSGARRARRGVQGVTYFDTLQQLAGWLRERRSAIPRRAASTPA